MNKNICQSLTFSKLAYFDWFPKSQNIEQRGSGEVEAIMLLKVTWFWDRIPRQPRCIIENEARFDFREEAMKKCDFVEVYLNVRTDVDG